MSMATWVIWARQAGSRSPSQSVTAAEVRPLTCANRPWSPVMSTRPVCQRSTHRRCPVSGSVSHLAFPRGSRRCPAPPPVRIFVEDGVGDSGQVVVHGVPAAAVVGGDRDHRAVLVEDLGGHHRLGPRCDPGSAGTPGTASVKTLRSQTALGHSHFRFRHCRRGRSGPTCTSRGPVWTQPFDLVERSPHSGQIPTHSGAVNTCSSRVPSERRCTDSTAAPSRSSSSELPSIMSPRSLFWMPENTQLTGARAPNQSPTRHNAGQHQTPIKCEEPVYAGAAIAGTPVLVRYADDMVACCHSREQAEHVKAQLARWLAPRGLVFNEVKTNIVHLEEGFDFLGFNVRRYRHGRRPGKLLIKPSPEAVERIRKRLAEEMRRLRGSNARAVIARMNPIIRGWSAYYRGAVSSKVFSSLDHYMWQLTAGWARRTHPKKPKKWIARRYWGRGSTSSGTISGCSATPTARWVIVAKTSRVWSNSPGLPSSDTRWSRAGRLPTTRT